MMYPESSIAQACEIALMAPPEVEQDSFLLNRAPPKTRCRGEIPPHVDHVAWTPVTDLLFLKQLSRVWAVSDA